MDSFMIAIIVLLISSFLGRRITQKANEKLNDDKKAQLVTLFSKSGIYNFVILILVLVLYFGNFKFNWVDNASANVVFAVFIVTFLIGTGYRTYKKLKVNEFPENYIKSNLSASAVRLLGLVLFFIIMNYF